MGLSFEVKESDLLGRIGSLKVGGKALETPYMFPVIHPVNQLIPPSELLSMGFRGLMTNSYILMKRRKAEALESGIHRLLGFDGIFITDSGGYQVLEYGDLDVGYADVAEFQAAIGTELAVTLDRPTGYPQRRPVARETVEYSLKNARATLAEFGGRPTAWVGPIQGGLYLDLVKRSAKALVGAGFGILALGSPVQVMENYMYSDLVDMVMAARRAIPYSVPLHLFGAGHPLTMPLAVALGCDTFDSASYVLFARAGRYMSRSGILTLQSMKYLPCSCPVCSKTTVKELLELDHQRRTGALSLHNLHVLREELEGCKEAISEGRLWDLVEERSMAHPRLRDAFLRMARYSADLEAGTPAMKERGLFVRSDVDLLRPELAMASRRLAGAAKRSSKKAVLLGVRERRGPPPAGADAYLLHPHLGPVPAELGFQYPFSQTESALAQSGGDAEGAKRRLRAKGYSSVSAGGKVRSRRNRRGASPSPRSSSARSR
ncbi:MAG: tRNA guanosine(15) transglycosylase TgtA [Nitrososphaerota archaeon]|nr:tRNA guanosine(15) transglycosylase TgtA [Nitrososphaerota archaeon]MDG6951577.1 tRNA guanosine(15) transglycosylase TgtA [Nitrososphaerota archaeon]